MSNLKLYLISAAIILLGVVFIALVWNTHNKYISLPVGLLGFLLIIGGLKLSGNISEHELKEKHPDYNDALHITSLKEKILHYGGFAAGLSCMFAFLFAGSYFDNTINGDVFFFKCSALGLLVAIAYYYLLKRVYPSFIRYQEQRMSSIFVTCIAIIAWTAVTLAYYNIQTARERLTIKTIVVSKSKNVRSSTRYLFVLIDGQKERFSPVKKEWESLNERDSVVLETGKGKLDYAYVFHFRKEEGGP